ncbi:MAG: DNA-binding protein WhiA [Candidatus Eremiobacteraeota bacterium]|nr:DNA-binding protein WhiA [Candidatus Eremiobacteraeota bacterium]MBV8356238.1 DNA-binding protein WhiA [Candidatus Eremiobacteraeota bacterium]
MAVRGRVALSADVKDALARDVPAAPSARVHLRDALARYGAVDRAFRTTRPAVARLARVLAGENATIQKIAGRRLYRTPAYEIKLPAPAERRPTTRADRRLEARGAFLAAGSIARPSRGYHLEFVIVDARLADRLARVLEELGVPPKRAERKGRKLLYYKSLDQIVGVLTQIGAHGAVLRLEDIRAMKETKNRIRRLVNSEAANLDRAVGAGAAQREAIALVADAYGLAKLSPRLREIAQLRVQHPDESLAELGKRCRPPIAKATANGRLAVVMRLARRLRAKPDDTPPARSS